MFTHIYIYICTYIHVYVYIWVHTYMGPDEGVVGEGVECQHELREVHLLTSVVYTNVFYVCWCSCCNC